MAYQIPAIAKGVFESLVEFWQWYERSRQAAIAANIDSLELDWLLERVAGIDKLALRLRQIEPDVSVQLKLDSLWQQRLCDRLPVQYLAGETTWRDLDLYVTPAVLIPRPETELLIDLAWDYCDRTKADTGEWVDLGTGSGAIALGLAKALPKANIHAVDRSAEALAIAKQNALRHGLESQIRFYQGNWFEPLEAIRGKVAGMVSNPPYIPTAEVEQLQPEVRDCEPRLALDGGSDGLEAIRYLIATAPFYLAIGGYWIVEVMVGQAPTVAEMLARSGLYAQIEIHQDRSGIERFVAAIVSVR
ncbi:peptide chain release factor N(5)-glutamine methyltransferase [Pseudanabaena sp. PCC 6802]|uniref:peptide chain release factor N(5)-glutamine methyltransferase n=1 Tax=Pseudanabaena sp. PCC 6802 TaxID=118173 RepID=UPI000348ACC3|nr:peptide chain release factor N(5)-glutamine methyltransferase [Pseudanabaena sp. PCC 6802]